MWKVLKVRTFILNCVVHSFLYTYQFYHYINGCIFQIVTFYNSIKIIHSQWEKYLLWSWKISLGSSFSIMMKKVLQNGNKWYHLMNFWLITYYLKIKKCLFESFFLTKQNFTLRSRFWLVCKKNLFENLVVVKRTKISIKVLKN